MSAETASQRTVPAKGAASLPKTGPSSVFDVAQPQRSVRVSVDVGAYRVEQGVPLPASARVRGGVFGPVLAKLTVGDSFLAPRRLDKTIRSSVRTYRSHHGGDYAVRTISETEIRIWRTA